ncbi:unnamed protein product, partial [Ixodes pacificus]
MLWLSGTRRPPRHREVVSSLPVGARGEHASRARCNARGIRATPARATPTRVMDGQVRVYGPHDIGHSGGRCPGAGFSERPPLGRRRGSHSADVPGSWDGGGTLPGPSSPDSRPWIDQAQSSEVVARVSAKSPVAVRWATLST